MNDDADRLIGLAMILGIGLWFSTREARMGGDSIWQKVRCQRCGALPIDAKGKATVNCPVCKCSDLGQSAPDYATFTAYDRQWLLSQRIAVA
jgi:phage FluMu protein Com